MAFQSKPDTAAGSAIYSFPFFLRFVYDWFVLGVTNTYIWRASTTNVQLPFFKQHVTSNHLDIGVGTGYYLANAQLPHDACLTLCDLNPDSLKVASNRVSHLQTKCLQHNVFNPLPTSEKYASISLMFLLHCLPGPPERKAALFGHLKDNLQEGGVLFGTTVLGKGVEHNWAGKALMWEYNRKGIFGNLDDGAEVFLKELKTHFEDVDARVEGVVLLFTARGPR